MPRWTQRSDAPAFVGGAQCLRSGPSSNHAVFSLVFDAVFSHPTRDKGPCLLPLQLRPCFAP